MFIILDTPKPYPGLTEFEKRNLMKYSFADPTTEPTSVYCTQSATNFSRFECLLVYASGLPNKIYDVRFSYSHQGDSGFLVVKVDPLQSTFRTRSLSWLSIAIFCIFYLFPFIYISILWVTNINYSNFTINIKWFILVEIFMFLNILLFIFISRGFYPEMSISFKNFCSLVLFLRSIIRFVILIFLSFIKKT